MNRIIPSVTLLKLPEAAKLLNLHPNYLHRLIRNMDIRKDLR